MRFKTRLKTSPHLIDLTPLVDVIFLLLIFFIVTSDTLPLKSLRVHTPTLGEDSAPQTSRLAVFMDAQHVIYVGHKKTIIDFPSLKAYLLEEKAALQKQLPQATAPSVVLNVDEKVDYATFLKLFKVVSECSSTVRLAYQAEEA